MKLIKREKSTKKQCQRKPLLVILGPTASGKSELALKLAKKLNGEIINADSRQIYKEMDIGTAKPTKKEMGKIPYHLLNIVRSDQNFSLAQYKKLALKTIRDIHQRNKLPMLVGGAGLYVQSIVDNLDIPRVPPNPKLRRELEKLTNQKLWQKLKKLDPDALKFIDKKNKRRLIRALEVCLITKKPFSFLRQKGQPFFNTIQIGLNPGFKNLDKKINQRVEKMIKMGLVREVKNLLKKHKPDLSAFSGIGYAEIIKYLNKEISLKNAVDLIKLHTRQYAKRQITWFKRDKRIRWVKNYKKAEGIVKSKIQNS